MGRKIILTVVAIVMVLAVVFFLGPRVAVDTRITFDPSAIGDDPDAYLAAQEARFPDIRDGLQKEIVWAFPASKARTPLSLVYIHGFSASRGEAAPLTELVAKELGANVFNARLAGHGRSNEAMTDGSINAWVNDFAEAMAIAGRIGEEVVIISLSTGSALTTWAMTQPELAQNVKGLVLISSNFKIKAGGSSLLTMPWGGQLLKLTIGPERSWEPRNEAQARLWTYRYPSEAVLPMAALAKLARESRVEDISVPALFMFSDADTIVDHSMTRAMAAKWGAPTEMEVIPEHEDSDNHLIVGDTLAPYNTQPFAGRITAWIRALP
jgi:alpha-beta hydrolase superfamily lysophospholipase